MIDVTELLCEKENIWDYLARDNKPVVVYGMGNGAEKIISTLDTYGVKVSDIFASDEFVRGHSFLGYKVMKYSEICEKYDDFNIVLAFASHLDNVLDRIKEINKEHKVFAPDVPVTGGGLFTYEFVEENEEKFDFVYQHLADGESKSTYLDIINFKISGKVDYLFKSFCKKEDVYSRLLCLNNHETIVDLGAYDGDTIREFTAFTKGEYNHIYALEPDCRNFKKLSRNTAGMENVTLYNMGAWDRKDTLIFDVQSSRNSKLSSKGVPVSVTDIDSLIDDNISMIKMDIEGAELHALEGCKSIISAQKPKLYICAYHRNEDLFSLPMKIYDIRDDYKLFFRHSKYIPAWESNFYAV